MAHGQFNVKTARLEQSVKERMTKTQCLRQREQSRQSTKWEEYHTQGLYTVGRGPTFICLFVTFFAIYLVWNREWDYLLTTIILNGHSIFANIWGVYWNMSRVVEHNSLQLHVCHLITPISDVALSRKGLGLIKVWSRRQIILAEQIQPVSKHIPHSYFDPSSQKRNKVLENGLWLLITRPRKCNNMDPLWWLLRQFTSWGKFQLWTKVQLRTPTFNCIFLLHRLLSMNFYWIQVGFEAHWFW